MTAADITVIGCAYCLRPVPPDCAVVDGKPVCNRCRDLIASLQVRPMPTDPTFDPTTCEGCRVFLWCKCEDRPEDPPCHKAVDLSAALDRFAELEREVARLAQVYETQTAAILWWEQENAVLERALEDQADRELPDCPWDKHGDEDGFACPIEGTWVCVCTDKPCTCAENGDGYCELAFDEQAKRKCWRLWWMREAREALARENEGEQ